MTEILARSARPNLGIDAQPYSEHVKNVVRLATKNVREASEYYCGDRKGFIKTVQLAAEYHDLGKIDEANQEVLASDSGRSALPINHVDAGVAHMFDPGINNLLAASLIFSHHIGLPDFQDQRNNKPGYVLRDNSISEFGQSIKHKTDQRLMDYLRSHQAVIGNSVDSDITSLSGKPSPLFFRIALSCLVDADHHDAARHYSRAVAYKGPDLKPADRLAMLDNYIAHLDKDKSGERTLSRNAVYKACRDAAPGPGMYACDSPVGTGKTTAVMAHMLRAAIMKGLRRIFVVLPFTNIIDQSVEVYRKSLICSGERGEDVVAAHHHRAEFEALETRQFAFLWHAPVVVTTAVQFFETLAGNHPSAIRKLHQVPGSTVFIDEAHAALPAHLWPQAWLWLRELISKWSCHVVFGSGSLNRFWEFEEFSEEKIQLPELVSDKVRTSVSGYEKQRIKYQSRPDTENLDSLLEWLATISGPRLLIVNTVQSAAVIAAEIAQRSGRNFVEHLSTALCPRDRKKTLDRVKHRLKDFTDSDWTLVATSCIEAGMELSFRNGLRERCSLNSLIQTGGRVNRKGKYSDSCVWDFQLQHEGLLQAHPAFDTSARILGELFEEKLVNPYSSTEAMRREIRQNGLRAICADILQAERNYKFPTVSDKFKVIDSETVMVIVDQGLIEKLEARKKVDQNLIQVLSVQIWRYRKFKYAIKPINGFTDLYSWTLLYDDFLGYMAGVLQVLKHQLYGTII